MVTKQSSGKDRNDVLINRQVQLLIQNLHKIMSLNILS